MTSGRVACTLCGFFRLCSVNLLGGFRSVACHRRKPHEQQRVVVRRHAVGLLFAAIEAFVQQQLFAITPFDHSCRCHQ